MSQKNINLNGILVRLKKIDDTDYVSLQDIANGYSPEDSKFLIRNWMRNADTIDYLVPERKLLTTYSSISYRGFSI
jgi:hypothetical protein